MLQAAGQTMTFCSDRIRRYYRHCLASNGAERHKPGGGGQKKEEEGEDDQKSGRQLWPHSLVTG